MKASFVPLLLLVATASAFVEPTATRFTSVATSPDLTFSRACVSLEAAKKKGAEKKERETVTDPAKLVLLYMTPWRNPNSIFVYLFGILYALGKYSEVHSLTGQ